MPEVVAWRTISPIEAALIMSAWAGMYAVKGVREGLTAEIVLETKDAAGEDLKLVEIGLVVPEGDDPSHYRAVAVKMSGFLDDFGDHARLQKLHEMSNDPLVIGALVRLADSRAGKRQPFEPSQN